ncbi:GAF domain-containing protein [Polaribacter sp. HaHaR_3_91]|uniref:GAF domain-containing protein n=1 Tax=unclassified Polaribacter TaxID=196858 RepID=UPI001C4F3C76|nr:GAF domain-containing protein [Polaribacter sp. HaHaR_3_91]QXP63287.1 GAF domain-containing protein [Polaribacter sp. HaHaR_3_91]
MKIIESKLVAETDLPLQLNVSFNKVFDLFKKYADMEYAKHPYHSSAKKMVQLINKHPELNDGFSDYSLLDKYKEQIDLLLNPLFPEPLLLNEIKAASIPFSFTSFKFTNRFENILKNAGENYELNVRNFEEDSMYIMACTFILSFVHGFNVDLKRPFYFDIPDNTTGTMKYYRTTFNGDFSDITATENAPKLTEKDFKELLNNFDNIALWKEKFPPNSYIFRGFGLISLFDVTSEEMLSSIKANLLKGGQNLIPKLQSNLRDFYSIRDLKLGYSIFDNVNTKICETQVNKSNSLILNHGIEINCDSSYFCNTIMQKVFKDHETFIISDVADYGVKTGNNLFSKNLQENNIQSIILIPIKATNNGDLALLEIASPRAYDLNSVNINKLKDIIPVFEAAVKRTSEERQNILEATIQENYTSIHSSVKWRFYEAAEKYHTTRQTNTNAKLDEIVFNDVYPLFGQSDIKGSSVARNKAIQEDLTTQLTLAITVLKDACKTEKLPIYNELMFRVTSYLNDVKEGLNAGDEINILDFLNREIYPVFNHINKISTELSQKVSVYMKRLDKNLNVVYEKRKEYENSVTLLNDKLAQFLDNKQKQAQEMFPHYFERYKTDGVEYNMYIGQAITKKKKFDDLYLYNLRLWQLQTTYEMENLAFYERKNMQHDLQVASLILVHSNAMAIKFRMDEKQFDVDGAYNIRYEIIKKRIDKANIKGTDERLTVPGKIAIVYSQDKDALEYIKYINYLQSKNQLGKIEFLELEDLQGASGLKALRVEVIYQTSFDENKTITFNDLIKEIEA